MFDDLTEANPKQLDFLKNEKIGGSTSENGFGTLYIVATPIGNLADVSLRMQQVLTNVDLIACEDTRHSGVLLSSLGIKNKLISYHDHNENERKHLLLERLKQGLNIALISDAGTPLICDPGYHLVAFVREHGIKVSPIPGASAMICALSVAGLPSDSFCFDGFLPAKENARIDKLTKLKAEARTIILYESKHRIIASLTNFQQVFGGEKHIVLARELTKTWETIEGRAVSDMLEWLKQDNNQTKGEFVLIFTGEGNEKSAEYSPEVLRSLEVLIPKLGIKEACASVAEIYSLKKNSLYKFSLENFKGN